MSDDADNLRSVLIVIVAAVVVAVLLDDAEAASNVPEEDACTRFLHSPSAGGGIRTYKLWTGSVADATDCPSPQGRPDFIKGDCIAWRGGFSSAGVPPSEPTQIVAYFFEEGAQLTHGSDGQANWANPAATFTFDSLAAFQGSTSSFCPSESGTYRAVVRACRTTNGACGSGTITYDINSDDGGNAGIGNTVTLRNVGHVEALDFWLGDPLWASAPSRVTTGATVPVIIHSEWDNGDYRVDAQADIFVYVVAPDGSFVVSGANPTQVIYPSPETKLGDYEITFTASMAGDYRITARVGSESRSSVPVWVTSAPGEATAADLAALQALLEGWIAGEARPWRATDNASARETTLTTRADTHDAAHAADEARWLGELRPARATLNATASADYVAGMNASLQDDHSALDAKIQDSNNTASGALSYATWSAWLTGGWLDARARLNLTATLGDLTAVNASQWLAHNTTRGDVGHWGTTTSLEHSRAHDAAQDHDTSTTTASVQHARGIDATTARVASIEERGAYAVGGVVLTILLSTLIRAGSTAARGVGGNRK